MIGNDQSEGGPKFSNGRSTPGWELDGLRSDSAFLDEGSDSKYNGFWNGINGNPVRIDTTPARGTETSRG